MTDKLRAAAQALVNRWDSPQWGGSAEHLRHTGEYIAELRAALAEQPAAQEPVAWWHKKSNTFTSGSLVSNFQEWMPLYTAPHPAKRVPLTPRELELIDGMIEVQLAHAERCDAIANRRMASKQKEWDMERVELLRKIRAHGITGETE